MRFISPAAERASVELMNSRSKPPIAIMDRAGREDRDRRAILRGDSPGFAVKKEDD